MSLGENIKRLRELHNLSQEELGKIAGVTDKAVSTWETGTKTPRMGAIQKMADHFGIKKSDIIEGQSYQDLNKPNVTDIVKIALFGTSEVSDAVLNDVKRYAEFVMQQERVMYIAARGGKIEKAENPAPAEIYHTLNQTQGDDDIP